MPPKKQVNNKTVKKSELIEDSSSSDEEIVNVEPTVVSDGSESETEITHEPVKKVSVKKTLSTPAARGKPSSKQSKKLDDDEEPIYAEQNSERPQRQRQQNKSVALNFRYEDYYEVDDPINTMSIEEILRHAVARSSKEGKKALMLTLRKTLQAMNSETSFPEFERPPMRPQQSQFPRPSRGGNSGGYRQYSNRGTDREQHFQEFE